MARQKPEGLVSNPKGSLCGKNTPKGVIMAQHFLALLVRAMDKNAFFISRILKILNLAASWKKFLTLFSGKLSGLINELIFL